MISFLRVRTDRHCFGILIWKHGTQKKKKKKKKTQSTKLGVDRSMLPLRTGMHNNGKNLKSNNVVQNSYSNLNGAKKKKKKNWFQNVSKVKGSAIDLCLMILND